MALLIPFYLQPGVPKTKNKETQLACAYPSNLPEIGGWQSEWLQSASKILTSSPLGNASLNEAIFRVHGN